MNTIPSSDLTVSGLMLVPVAKTASSICLSVRKCGMIQREVGWLDVHHPCDGHIKTQTHGVLPDSLLAYKELRFLVEELLRWLEIPANETWELRVSAPHNQIGMSNPVNAEGMTDRIETSRRYTLPKT